MHTLHPRLALSLAARERGNTWTLGHAPVIAAEAARHAALTARDRAEAAHRASTEAISVVVALRGDAPRELWEALTRTYRDLRRAERAASDATVALLRARFDVTHPPGVGGW